MSTESSPQQEVCGRNGAPAQADTRLTRRRAVWVLWAISLLAQSIDTLAQGGGEEHAALAARWVSALVGFTSIWVIFFCLADLFPEDPRIALFTASFVALLPMSVALYAPITSGTLSDLAVTLGLWQMVRIATRICRRPHSAAILGAVLGLGLWTKTPTLVLFPTALVFYGLAVRNGVLTRPQAIQGALVSCGLGLLIGLPHLIFHAPPAIYAVLALLGAAWLAGCLLFRGAAPVAPAQKTMLSTFAVLACLCIAVFAASHAAPLSLQGSALYPALASISLFFVFGLRGLFGRAWTMAMALVFLGMVCLNVYTLVLLAQRFGT